MMSGCFVGGRIQHIIPTLTYIDTYRLIRDGGEQLGNFCRWPLLPWQAHHALRLNVQTEATHEQIIANGGHHFGLNVLEQLHDDDDDAGVD